MSKLYNAICRLDEIAVLQKTDPAAPDIPFQPNRNKSGSALFRMLILSAALILFGLVAIGTTAWWQGWLEPQKGATIETEPVPASPSDTSVSSFSATLETTEETEKPAPQLALPTLPPGEILPQSREERLSPAITDQRAATTDSMPEDRSPTVINRLPAKAIKKIHQIEQQPLEQDNITTEPRPLQIAEYAEARAADGFIEQTAQLSRWLHQAEQRRRAGDWEGAISLFTQVWQISENTAVANNLAASLIQLDRFPEAREILTKALRKTPNDQDLQQNLNIVQQLAHE